ncbi:MAG: hypothetical protein LBN32_00320 [Helicobacteraceae bacterium]|jgi:hypothetical protein|nr:hypothetical protein [Helicobacteraceae bacterium]
MAEQELKIKISVDPQTGKIQIVNKALDLTIKSADHAAKNTNELKEAVDLLAHGTQAITGLSTIFGGLTNSIRSAIQQGIQYNATLEQTQLALKATISGYIDAASGAERIAKADALATSQMDKLRAASAETGIAFNEITAAFKTFLPGALNVGMSMDGATKASVRLTQAAKMQGIEFNALLAGIDGVAKGTILANSDFGRFLGSLGLTNEALKIKI